MSMSLFIQSLVYKESLVKFLGKLSHRLAKVSHRMNTNQPMQQNSLVEASSIRGLHCIFTWVHFRVALESLNSQLSFIVRFIQNRATELNNELINTRFVCNQKNQSSSKRSQEKTWFNYIGNKIKDNTSTNFKWHNLAKKRNRGS